MRRIGFVVLAGMILISLGCAKPLAVGKDATMQTVAKTIPANPNTIYYAVKWAMDQCGYPLGTENLADGVIESKWVPVGAASHYVDSIAGKDYGANAAYYKMIITIVPVDSGDSRVEAQTVVKSIVNDMMSTGDKEREILAKITEHSRTNNIEVTNLGVE